MSQRILIIDDAADERRLMRRMLETAGYVVGEAANGPQGLAAFGDGATWDLVLVDYRMPGMDGLDVLRGLEERAPTARVILVTAFASRELEEEAMQLGATDCMRKPMTAEILCNMVAAALAQSSETPPSDWPEADTRAAQRRIEAHTMNGFRIARVFDTSGQAPGKSGEYQFTVRSLTGNAQTVVVDVRPEAITMVEKATHHHFPHTSTFWAIYAEHKLATYLWDEGHIPSSRLTITQVQLKGVKFAAR